MIEPVEHHQLLVLISVLLLVVLILVVITKVVVIHAKKLAPPDPSKHFALLTPAGLFELFSVAHHSHGLTRYGLVLA